MTKTLEQIQEENRKAIILANNSEAKSYEEALEMELDKGCQAKTIQSPFSPKHKKTVISNILWNAGIDEAGNERFYCHRDDHTFTIIKRDCKIIGKPLTLDRVLIALEDVGRWGRLDVTIVKGKINIFFDAELTAIFFDAELTAKDRHIDIDWDLTKPTLEEQTEETQRKINELLTKN